MKQLSENLLTRLTQADICCRDCGARYGKYSVGCSSTWMGTCGVCGEEKGVTEVRDWGYLTRGINELRGDIKEQSKEVAKHMEVADDFIKNLNPDVYDYMKSVGPIMNDDELEDALLPSYEQGEITLKLTEDEVGFLNECLDVIVDNHESLCPGHSNERPEDIALFESIEKKITELYADNCVKYELSPALKKFYELYGTYGTENDVEKAKWEVFRDAFHAGFEHSKEGAN